MKRCWVALGYNEKGEVQFIMPSRDFYSAYDEFLYCSKKKKWHCYLRLGELYTLDELDSSVDDELTSDQANKKPTTSCAPPAVVCPPPTSYFHQRLSDFLQRFVSWLRTRWSRWTRRN
jgi:hypothetical protein